VSMWRISTRCRKEEYVFLPLPPSLPSSWRGGCVWGGRRGNARLYEEEVTFNVLRGGWLVSIWRTSTRCLKKEGEGGREGGREGRSVCR